MVRVVPVVRGQVDQGQAWAAQGRARRWQVAAGESAGDSAERAGLNEIETSTEKENAKGAAAMREERVLPMITIWALPGRREMERR